MQEVTFLNPSLGDSSLFMSKFHISGALNVFSCCDSGDSAVENVFSTFGHNKRTVSVLKIGHKFAINRANFVEAMNNNLEISSVWNVNFVCFFASELSRKWKMIFWNRLLKPKNYPKIIFTRIY